MELLLVSLRLEQGIERCEKGPEVFLEGTDVITVDETQALTDDRFCCSLFGVLLGCATLWQAIMIMPPSVSGPLRVGPSVGSWCPSWKPRGA